MAGIMHTDSNDFSSSGERLSLATCMRECESLLLAKDLYTRIQMLGIIAVSEATAWLSCNSKSFV